MARLSKADQVIIDQAEDLIRRIHIEAGTDRSINQVLQAEPLLQGEARMIVRLFVELDHIKVDSHPMLTALIDSMQ